MSEEGTILDRILRSLSHPMRRRILLVLLDGTGSASSLAQEFKEELSVVSYHLNRVLAKECEAVELVESIPRRGSLEKVYGLSADLWGDPPDLAEGGNSRALRRMSPGECFLEGAELLGGRAIGQLKGSSWEWFSAIVDDKAWKAIGEAREDFNKRIEEAVAESQKRGQGKAHEVIVGAAAFPAARSTPSP